MSDFLHYILPPPDIPSPHIYHLASLQMTLFLSSPSTSPPLVENVQLSLVLQTENKGSVVAGGELNVCLDGMVVDLGSLPNGSTAADSESHLHHTSTHSRIHTLTLILA